MTYKELVELEEPWRMDEQVFGGVEGCPPDGHGTKCVMGKPSRANCERCWNREVNVNE